MWQRRIGVGAICDISRIMSDRGKRMPEKTFHIARPEFIDVFDL